MKGWKKLFHANGHEKEAGVAILISDKIDFKIKTVTKVKEEHYTLWFFNKKFYQTKAVFKRAEIPSS